MKRTKEPGVAVDGAGKPGRRPRPTFAALDLGTNNCRLLIAEPAGASFRVIDGYSQIVRLGEGLTATGRLSEAAMARTLKALAVCAGKIAHHRPAAVACIATQACRVAENGAAFLARAAAEVGLSFDLATPQDEARLAVLGCAALLDPAAEIALVVDIGGGSTELSWVDVAGTRAALRNGRVTPRMFDWASTPIGVVTLAESHPEQPPADEWYDAMVSAFKVRIAGAGPDFSAAFAAGRAHIVGTSGAITSLAGVHLDLPRYQRSRVDGLWMTRDEVARASRALRDMSLAERAAHPCIGPDRADLVVPGCAILEAVCDLWPVTRLRVADRGLREGMLMTLMAKHGAGVA